jgi:integrase/recombinase XerD
MAEENIYKRGEVYWLKAMVGGVQFRESLKTGDVREARRLRDARLKTIRAAVERGGRRTWKEAVVAWADHVAGQVAESTMTRYVSSLRTCGPLLDNLHLDEVDGKLVARLVQSRRADGASPTTVRRDLTAISGVIEHAISQDWIEANPTLPKRKGLRERRDPIRLPTEESMAAVLKAASPEFADLLVAARLTGARQAELVGLKWPQFDKDAGTLEITAGKGNKRRVVALSPAALAHFKGLARRGPTVFGHMVENDEGAAVWTPFVNARWDHRRYVAQAARAEAKRRAKEGQEGEPEFQRFKFHDLRHLYAVETLRSGTGIYALSRDLGHSSVAVTEIYLTFLSGDQAQRARAA